MVGDPSDAELTRLVSELTSDEKVQLLAGKNVWETAGVERLGIPSLKVVASKTLVVLSNTDGE